MNDFESMQLAGMQPSLLNNKLNLAPKTLRLLFAKIRVLPNGCWEWTAAKIKGYGVIKIRALRKTSPIQAHRLTHQMLYGVIPEDVLLHHKVEDNCIGPACCHPWHTQKTSRAEHIRELSPNSLGYAGTVRPLACTKGHPWTIENIAMYRGRRRCRECLRIREQARRDAAHGDNPKFKKTKFKSHCSRGHELSGDNLFWYKSQWGPQRMCRTCRAIRGKAQKEKERQARKAAKDSVQ